MHSIPQGSAADVENNQSACCTTSPNPSPGTPPQQSPTPKLSEDDDGNRLPPTPPTPKPWMWKCHWCDEKYQFEATIRCLYDGHYFCSGAPSKRNNSHKNGNKKKKRSLRWGTCRDIFDYSGWQAMRAWQKQVRRAKGKEEEQWESGCINDCVCPCYCTDPTTPPTPPGRFGPQNNTTVFSDEPVSLDPQYDDSSLESDAENKTTDAPSETPPAKRRKLMHNSSGCTTRSKC